MVTSYKNANGIIMGKHFTMSGRSASAVLLPIGMKTYHKFLTATLRP